MTQQDTIQAIRRGFGNAVEVVPDQINGGTYCIRTLIDHMQLTEYLPLKTLDIVALAMLNAEYKLSLIRRDGKRYGHITQDEARHLINNGVPFTDLQ